MWKHACAVALVKSPGGSARRGVGEPRGQSSRCFLCPPGHVPAREARRSRPCGFQILASSKPSTASVLLSTAITGRMKNPADTPSPAGPKPRRRSSRPAKLISVVSWAATICRPAQAAAVPAASVATISPHVTEAADKDRWTRSHPHDHSRVCGSPAVRFPTPAQSAGFP